MTSKSIFLGPTKLRCGQSSNTERKITSEPQQSQIVSSVPGGAEVGGSHL